MITYLEFVRLVAEMRTLQKQYFRERSKRPVADLLEHCKDLERRVDAAVKEYFNPQRSLFDAPVEPAPKPPPGGASVAHAATNSLQQRMRTDPDPGPLTHAKLFPDEATQSCGKVSIECVGHGGRGTHKCCDRAGEYNGYASDGGLLFDCPEHCSCHD